jgi:PAS domain S-box-containing protein
MTPFPQMTAKKNAPGNELGLASFTLDNLREAVFWIASNGDIVNANGKACELSGYTKMELVYMNILDLNPTKPVADFHAYWKKLKRAGRLVFESQHRHKSGYLYDIEVRANFIAFEGVEYSCSVVTDIRNQKLEQGVLKKISEWTTNLTGEDFFQELAKCVTSILGVRYAVVTECTDLLKTKVKTLAYVDRNLVKRNVEYALKGTPCEVVIKSADFFSPGELDSQILAESDIRAYVAVPILSASKSEVIGHIACFDKAEIVCTQDQVSLLKIFAARAGAEMEKLEAQRKWQNANAALQLHLQEISILRNQLRPGNIHVKEKPREGEKFEGIISASKKFRKILKEIELVAATDVTVLITGESGTGKELIAKAIHKISKRGKNSFVKINCAALPASLIESELFGHERGAFTGATERKIGRFELADGGTIFLDEIGELPIELQTKLLRVLQEGEFERLGSRETVKINARLLAATNRNLELGVERKEFREDLYYRLNVFPIHCLPLRERKEDIPLLVKHFCRKCESKTGRTATGISSKAMTALTSYDWPGNIRELENIIERAIILSDNGIIEYGDWIPKDRPGESVNSGLLRLDEVEKGHITAILKQTNWKLSGENGAAKMLGLSVPRLEAKMKKLGIKREIISH